MEVFDILLVGIEASIALAGFAGIIATYQIRDVAMIRRGPIGALTVVVQFSLLSALGCAIPMLLHTFGVRGTTLWAVGSAIAAMFTAIGGYSIVRSMRGSVTTTSRRLLFVLLEVLGAFVALALILNAADLVFHREPGPLVVAVLYALSVAGYMFSRVLLLPLWRIVRENEAANSGVESPT